MKFKKTKKLHTVESYAACICATSTCSCSCANCRCLCASASRPAVSDRANGVSDANNYMYSRDFSSNMSSQNVQM